MWQKKNKKHQYKFTRISNIYILQILSKKAKPQVEIPKKITTYSGRLLYFGEMAELVESSTLLTCRSQKEPRVRIPVSPIFSGKVAQAVRAQLS